MIRDVPPSAIVGWLRSGWADFVRSPAPGLLIGSMCTTFAWTMLIVLQAIGVPVLILPLTAGFVFIAPRLAIGLYESSRRQEGGQTVTITCLLEASECNRGQIWAMGALLACFLLGWMAVAYLVLLTFTLVAWLGGLAFFFDATPLALDEVAVRDWDLLLYAGLAGAVLAVAAFGLSAISLPMLIDRPVAALTAAVTSVRACMANPLTAGLWGATLLLLSLVAAAPAFLGFVVVLPVLGHASWHAYRALVGPEQEGPFAQTTRRDQS
ncbi:MAG: DUF2189 domain-containing protein [Acetobacteraceae bacterium]|nr:DUF2189 domain-containing protein [Acetobacteraceae bacterium]